MSESSETSPDDYVEIRQKKRDELIDKGKAPYAYNYDRTHTARDAKGAFDRESDEKLGARVSVAGRITAERLHGGAAFLDLQDQTGRIQIYLSGKYLDDEDEFETFEQLWDIGDIVGVEGELFETNEGEISILVRNSEMLSKGLRPLPEKFHGLQDKELRFRKRYLDLISNNDVREIFRTRSKFISILRDRLQDDNFREVETPMMHSLPGGAEAEPFRTHHNALDRDLFLRVAPELYLKRLIVGGFEKVFEINRNFRNEGLSRRHNPEFTMLELYRAYADYRDIMSLTENVLSDAVEQLHDATVVEFQENDIDWSTPWSRRPLVDLVNDETGLEVDLECTADEIYESASAHGLDVEPCSDPGEQIVEIFEEFVEDCLIQPTFVTDFPSSTSPLAKEHREKSNSSERFELFVGGLEVGNAYSELKDPLKQRENFRNQVENDEDIDEDYLEALEYGMPPTGGLGLGIDRLIMLMTDTSSIREVILFPTLRER